MTTERQEQAALFEWAELMTPQHPELALMFAIPNGQMRKGMPMEPGMQKGVPDIFLPVSVDGWKEGKVDRYYGLFIEMKKPGGKLRRSQSNWINALKAQGYCAVCCYGFDEAKENIEWYLGMNDG